MAEITFTTGDLKNIADCILDRMYSLESIYRRNVDIAFDYAFAVAGRISYYEKLYHRITGLWFITSSDSLESYLNERRE